MRDPVLVIGAGGFIGRWLARQLADEGTPVIAACRSAADIAHPLIEVVRGEFREPEHFLPLLERCRAVVHLATASTPGTTAMQPLREIDGNLRVTAALLQAMQHHAAIDLLYLSSGGSLYADTTEAPSNEMAPVRPRSFHGAAKLAAEAFVHAWCAQASGHATVIRPSNVYGPGQPERTGFGIIPAAFGAISRNEELLVWGDGSARRDYVYIEDLVRLCKLVLAKPMPLGSRILNACSGESVSLDQLFALIESVAGSPLRLRYSAGRSVDASCIAMDPSLAAQVYGWRHAVRLHEGLCRTWEFHDARE